MLFNLVFFVVFINAVLSVAINCTDIEVNPILPIGCNVILSWLFIKSNTTQQELVKYSEVTEIKGGLEVEDNNVLLSLEGLNSLMIIGDDLNVINNNNLRTLGALSSLTTVRDRISIRENNALTEIKLNSLRSLRDVIHIYDNRELLTIEFESMGSLPSSLLISRNEALKSLDGINVTSIESIYIYSNPALESLDALRTMTRIGSRLRIYNNTVLKSLSGLQSAIIPASDQSEFKIGYDSDLNEIPNPQLDCSNVCNRKVILELKTNVRPAEIRDQCGVSSFNCPGGENTISAQKLNCEYNTVCSLCDESTCEFIEPVKRQCNDGIKDIEEECDNEIKNDSTQCPYGEPSCEFCNSTCNLVQGNISYCGDGIKDIEEECDNTTDSLCINCTVVLPTFSSTSTSTSSQDSTSVTKSSDSRVSFTNEFDCVFSSSCVISDNGEIKIFTVETLNLDSNLVILNNQQLRITYGNLTLNGFNLSLSASSTIKVQNGCLDAKDSSLYLNLSDTEITEKKSFNLIEYECITNQFRKTEVYSNSGICLVVDNIYTANRYTVLISEDPYCVNVSPRFSITQMFYLFIFVAVLLF